MTEQGLCRPPQLDGHKLDAWDRLSEADQAYVLGWLGAGDLFEQALRALAQYHDHMRRARAAQS